MAEPKWTPGPWHLILDDTGGPFTRWPGVIAAPELDLTVIHRAGFKQEFWGDTNIRVAEANARLIAAAPTQDAALNYVADMTYCGADAEWHFKPGYDPQIVLDALALARGDIPEENNG